MLWHGKNFRGIINKAKEMIFDNTGTDIVSTNAEDAIKEVNSNLSQKLQIKESTSIGFNVPATDQQTQSYTFTETYATPPIVIPVPGQNKFTLEVSNITTTGFTATARNITNIVASGYINFYVIV